MTKVITSAVLLIGTALAPGAWDAQRSAVPAGHIVAASDMTAARFDHTATLLPNGKVLIVGGLQRNGVMQPTAEVFDPASGRFAPSGKLQVARGWGATAVRLANGKVLVAGGSSGTCGSCSLSEAELYDPATGVFSSTGSMSIPRASAVSVLLPNGDALIAGGAEANTAELYHSATGTFSRLTGMHVSDPIQAVLLRNGRVLVIGESGAELYDPSSQHFVPTGAMALPRKKFGAALLPDGRVLIAGGQIGGAWGNMVASTELYDPQSGRFTPGPELNLKRFKLMKAVVPLRDGRILVAGGANQPEVYDPASRAFVPVPGSKLDGFCFSTATLLSNGEVLLAGGYPRGGEPGTRHAWLYQP